MIEVAEEDPYYLLKMVSLAPTKAYVPSFMRVADPGCEEETFVFYGDHHSEVLPMHCEVVAETSPNVSSVCLESSVPECLDQQPEREEDLVLQEECGLEALASFAALLNPMIQELSESEGE